MTQPASYQHLIATLDQLPGIGPQAAQRLTDWLLATPAVRQSLQQALAGAKTIIRCPTCRRYQLESDACGHCANLDRSDLVALAVDERSAQQIKDRGFPGVCWVSHGVLSPVNQQGPRELGLNALSDSLATWQCQQLWLFLPDSVEGRTTEMFINQLLSEAEVEVHSVFYSGNDVAIAMESMSAEEASWGD